MPPCLDNAAVTLTCLQTLDTPPSCPSPCNICQEQRKHELGILGIQKQFVILSMHEVPLFAA